MASDDPAATREPGADTPGGTATDAEDVTTPTAPNRRAGPSSRRSRLGRLTAGVLLVVLGVAWLLHRLEVVDLGVIEVLALALLVVGLGLLIGSWWGRSRGLILWGVLLTLVLAVASTVQTSVADAGVIASSGVGERTWAPSTAEEIEPSYELGVGEATLDLSRTDFDGESIAVSARVGMGELTVYVPDDVDVTVDGTIRVGDMRLLDTTAGGVGTVSRTVADNVDDPEATLSVEARVGIGNLVVQRQ